MLLIMGMARHSRCAAGKQRSVPGVEVVPEMSLRLQIQLKPVPNAHKSGWACTDCWGFRSCEMMALISLMCL